MRRGHDSRLPHLLQPTGADRPASVLGCVAWLGGQLGEQDPEFKAIRGAITTIAAVIHRIEDRRRAIAKDLPADPVQLRALLAAALPAALKVSASRWSNAKSLFKALLMAAGWVSADARGWVRLSGPWGDTLQLVPSDELRLPLATRQSHRAVRSPLCSRVVFFSGSSQLSARCSLGRQPRRARCGCGIC